MLPYLYPNRPLLVPPDPLTPLQPKPDYINSLEASGKWIAERKWNGDNCLLYTGPVPQFWSRHKSRLVYTPTPQVLAEVRAAFPDDCIINLECVHKKTKTVKHHLVAHCVLAWKGEILQATPWGESRKLLEGCTFGKHLVLSETFKTGFWELFQAADGAIIEGIVLKDPTGIMKVSTTPLPDVSWMRKIRKPCAKYNF